MASGLSARPLSVNDLLALEAVSEARPSPDGKFILFVRTRPALKRMDFAQDTILGPKTGKLFLVDVNGSTTLRPLLEAVGADYTLGPFSPDSKRVLLYRVAGRAMTLGSLELSTGRFTQFQETPRFSQRTDFGPVWLSDREIIFNAGPAGEQPFDLFNRSEAARKLKQSWELSWSGKRPGVILSQSRTDGGGHTPEPGSLVRADVITGRTRSIVQGAYSDLRVSADGRYLGAVRHYVSGQPPVTLNLDWNSDRRLKPVIFDLRSGERMFEGAELTAGLGSLLWSPTSNRLAFFGWDPDGTSLDGRFQVYDVARRKLSTFEHRGLDLVSERERGWFPRPEAAAWLGDGLAVAARKQSDPRAQGVFTPKDYARADAVPDVGWFLLQSGGRVRELTSGMTSVAPVLAEARDDELRIIADGNLWAIGPNGRRTRLLDGEYEGLRLAFPPSVRTADRSQPLVLEATHGQKPIYLLPDGLEDGRALRVDAGAGQMLLAMTPKGAALISDEARLRTDILLRKDGQNAPLVSLNGHLEKVDLGERRQLAFRTTDGELLSSCLLLPPGYVAGKRYPMIVHIYPGLTGTCPPASVHHGTDEELLAARGYIVLRPGNPVHLIKTADGPIAGMPAVIRSAIGAAVGAGYAHPDRVGLWGMSQGGWSSLWLATQMQEFKAVVSAQGWVDLPGHYLGADYRNLLFPEDVPYAANSVRYEPSAGSEQSIGKTLWEAPDIYVRNSSTMHIDKVTAPIMLVSSDMDIFPLWQYQEMYSGLYRLRKPACLVVYMGEGHWPESPANLRDLWSRMFGWFDAHLNGRKIDSCTKPAPSLNDFARGAE